MSRRKAVASVDVIPEDVNRDLVFQKISAGFFWDIRSDLMNGVPQLFLNLTLIESVEFMDIDGVPQSGRRVFLSSGKVYEFKSQSQVIDLMLGLNALKNFVIKGKI
jgi:hypothetical protein